MQSPLGQYAPIAALVAAIGILAAFATAALTQDTYAVNTLQPFALAAIVGIYGQALGVNGWKAPVQALHSRLDAAGIPPAGNTGGEGHE